MIGGARGVAAVLAGLLVLGPLAASAQDSGGDREGVTPDQPGLVIEQYDDPIEEPYQETEPAFEREAQSEAGLETDDTRSEERAPVRARGAVEVALPTREISLRCLDDAVVRDTGWCQNPPQTPDHVLVCYEEREGQLCPVVIPSRHVLYPNTPLRVIVLHRTDRFAVISLGGVQGLYQPPVDSQTRGGAERLRVERMGAVMEDPMTLSTQVFAPRTTGNANVMVTLIEGEATRATSVTELIVQDTYSGALRVGIGMVFGGATSRTYAVQLLPGSGQHEIVATGGGDVDMEIVVGFAPFVEAFWGGRSYQNGAHLSSFPFGFSPYIGIGVVGTTSGGGIEGLTAFYVGLEWEPMRGLSVAGTLVARRVDRLQPGLEVGDPALGGGGVTRNGYELGWGVVVSFSPDVLQVAGIIR